MEEEKSRLEILLEKIHINIYDFNYQYEEMEDRNFLKVIEDLAESWETLNDDYKNELYEAMGIVPPKPKLNCSKDTGGICGKDTGIEYWQNQPTCKEEV